MKKIMLIMSLMILIMLSLATAQLEPVVTNVSGDYTYFSSFDYQTTPEIICEGISSTEMWCFSHHAIASRYPIFIVDTSAKTVTNPYNISRTLAGVGFTGNGDPCEYYSTDGMVYCFGGGVTIQSYNWKIDPSIGTVTQLANWTQNDYNTGADCSLRPNNGEVYCWGGGNVGGTGLIMRKYDIAMDTTEDILVTDYFGLTTGRVEQPQCDFTDDDTLVCYGGYINASGESGARGMEYDVVSNTTSFFAGTQPFTAGTCKAIDGILYCAYGVDDDLGTPLDVILAYDPDTNTFSVLNATLPVGTVLYGEAGLIGTNFYNLGGYVTDNYDESNDIFEIAFTVPTPASPSSSGYNATFESSDISAIIIDTIGGVGVILVSLSGIVALFLLWTYFRKGKIK